MTTNARDEKWSSWIDWSGGDCPLPDGVEHSVKIRSGETGTDDEPESWRWHHNGGRADIIAYRYKIKELESAMHPDLEWLARNVGEWDENYTHIGVLENIQDSSKSQEVFANPDLLQNPITQAGKIVPLFTKAQWLQARKDLGLIISDAEEEMRAEEWNGYVDAVDEQDNVNKPKHYQLREGYEVYDLRQDLAAKAANGGATYDQYSDWDRAIEYIVRMWGKNRLEDAKKGRWYLDKLIGKLEAQE